MEARIVSRAKVFEPYTLENIVNVTYSNGKLVLTIDGDDGLYTLSYTEEVVVAIY